ncbi:MAG: MBL fold metallo-hydrolase, partial [Spirochaetales bacterium]
SGNLRPRARHSLDRRTGGNAPETLPARGLEAPRRLGSGARGRHRSHRIPLLRRAFTPGHSFDQICLYEPDKKWLFTGDLFCGRKIKYFRRDEDYTLLLAALSGLAELEVDTIFCSLLGVVSDGTRALRDKVAFMTCLREEALSLREKGLSPRAIARRLLGREGAMFYITGGHYAKLNAVHSILGGGPVDAWPG